MAFNKVQLDWPFVDRQSCVQFSAEGGRCKYFIRLPGLPSFLQNVLQDNHGGFLFWKLAQLPSWVFPYHLLFFHYFSLLPVLLFLFYRFHEWCSMSQHLFLFLKIWMQLYIFCHSSSGYYSDDVIYLFCTLKYTRSAENVKISPQNCSIYFLVDLSDG